MARDTLLAKWVLGELQPTLRRRQRALLSVLTAMLSIEESTPDHGVLSSILTDSKYDLQCISATRVLYMVNDRS